MTKQALVLIDLQNDFCAGGALAVPHGDEVIPLANRLAEHFEHVIASQDWHPENHSSFAANHPGHRVGEVVEINGVNQILWPVHCVQSSAGAQFHPELRQDLITHIVQKGKNKQIDSYSIFFDNARLHATGLDEYFKAHQITHLVMLGLATDYCVKFSALDARQLGYDVTLVQDACRGVGLYAGDIVKALEEMQKAGVKIVQFKDIGLSDNANER